MVDAEMQQLNRCGGAGFVTFGSGAVAVYPAEAL